MPSLEVIHNKLENWDNPENKKYHCVIADPPYFLSLFSNKWDKDNGIEQNIYTAKIWGESLKKHLYPGSIVMMFSSSRTSHYLAVGMEQAGFELYDTCHFLFGTGYPKSQSIKMMANKDNKILSSDWDDYKTRGFKGAYEPLLCFVAPDEGNTYVELASKYGTGAMNIKAGRIPIKEKVSSGIQHQKSGTSGMSGLGSSGYKVGYKVPMYNFDGRFPSNVILCDKTAKDLDISVDNEDGVSRYFYTSKVQNDEREAGVKGNLKRNNHHPTIKSIELIKYFSSIILPPASVGTRRVLIPFAGVFSEVIGAALAGFDEITAIEQDKEYIEIGEARYKWWLNKSKELNTTDIRKILNHAKDNEPVDSEISWLNI